MQTTTENKTETAVTEPTNIFPNSTTTEEPHKTEQTFDPNSTNTEEQPKTEQTYNPNPETDETNGWSEYTGSTFDTTEESRLTPETTDAVTEGTESNWSDKTTIEIEPTDYTLPSNSTEPETTENIYTTTEDDVITDESTTEEVILESTTPEPEVCPNNETIINIPYPGNCTLYILCIMGNDMGIFSCPSGLLFDTGEKECKLKDIAVCTVENFWK